MTIDQLRKRTKLELLHEAEIAPESQLGELVREANELLAITVSSIKTARLSK